VAEPDFANIVIIAALIVVSCLITYLSSQRTLKQASADARQQLELRLEGFTGTIAALEGRVAELTRTTAALFATAARSSMPAATLASDAARTNGAVSQPLAKPGGEIPTEILIVIGAAVTSFLGKKVRLRSAKMLQSPYEIVNPWSQQGRVIVQASHSLRSWSRQ
jgi:hypothetical protein